MQTGKKGQKNSRASLDDRLFSFPLRADTLGRKD